MRSVKHVGPVVAALIATVAGGAAGAADCPPITVANNQGITGEFPYQFELAEFQDLAKCTLAFSENPAMAELTAES